MTDVSPDCQRVLLRATQIASFTAQYEPADPPNHVGTTRSAGAEGLVARAANASEAGLIGCRPQPLGVAPFVEKHSSNLNSTRAWPGHVVGPPGGVRGRTTCSDLAAAAAESRRRPLEAGDDPGVRPLRGGRQVSGVVKASWACTDALIKTVAAVVGPGAGAS